jgi:PAS domain S-box-containing protein
MKIKNQIVLIIIIAIGLISFIGYISWRRDNEFKATKIKEFQAGQLNFVRQLSDKLETKCLKLYDALYSLSQMPKVQFIRKNEALLHMIRVFKMNKGMVEGIFRVDASNRLILSYPKKANRITQSELKPIFQHARMTGKSLFKVIRRSSDGEDMLVIARSVYTVQGEVHLNPSNKFAGLILFTLSLNRFQEKFLGTSVFGKKGYPWILDEAGLVVATANEQYLGRTLEEIYSSNHPISEKETILKLFKKMQSGEEAILSYSFHRKGLQAGEKKGRGVDGEMEFFEFKPDTGKKDIVKLVAFTQLKLRDQTWSIAVTNPMEDATQSIDKAISERWFHSVVLFVTVACMMLLLVAIIVRNHLYQMKLLREGEEAMRESEEKYRTLVEQSSDAILIMQQGETVYQNQAFFKLLGIPKTDSAKHDIFELVVSEDRMKISELYRNRRHEERLPEKCETCLITPVGQKVIVEIKHRSIKYQGQPAIMLTISNLTERKQAEIALKESKRAAESANLAKSEFLANMSHELRTPLNHIIGFTELVLDSHFGELNEIQREYLQDVEASSKHLLSLINDILDLSKVEAGKMELEATDIDLKGLLESSLIMVKEKAMKHNIKLSTEINGIPETVKADERKIKQIIYNLVSNGVKFTPDGGSVALKAKRVADPSSYEPFNSTDTNGDIIEISVTDTGIGLKQEDLSRIFEPFEQADASSTRQYQGTGLGLSLTKNLVELHGGRIWADSEGEGQGSTFCLAIPVIQ